MKRVLFVVLCLLICGVSASQMRGLNRDFKYTHSGMQDENYPCPSINPACLHSRWNFETAVAGTYTSDVGGFVMTVNGAPVRVDDGTWPHADGIAGVQGQAWSFDGAADYLSRVDDGSFDMDLVNNPGPIPGSFSIQCVVTPSTIAAGLATIISKYNTAGNRRAWRLYRSTAGTSFTVSADGTAVTTVGAANSQAAYRPAFITVTYQYVGAANSQSRIYVDNLATATSNVMVGPIHDTNGNFEIGAYHTGLAPWAGLIHDCKIYKGVVVTEAQHDAMFAQWQGRASTFARDVVTSTASASPPAIPFAPPASGTEPFLIDSPANSFYIGSPAAGSGGLYGASGTTSFVHRGCFVSGVVGWTPTTGGAATIAADLTASAYGAQSIRFTHTGAGDTTSLDSTCVVGGIGADLYVEVYAEDGGDTSSCAVQVLEYDTAICGTLLATNNIQAVVDLATDWTKYHGLLAAGVWNVATSSYYVRLLCADTGGAYTANWGAVQAYAGSSPKDSMCCTDAAASAVCTDTIHSILSPISANGQMSIWGTWRTPYAGTDVVGAQRSLMTDGVLAANNSYCVHIAGATDEAAAAVFDNAGGVRAVLPNVANWAADTDYEVVVRTGGNNNLGVYWNDAWDTTAAGAGTGVRNAAQANSYISGDDTNPGDVWTRDLRFYKRMLEVIP